MAVNACTRTPEARGLTSTLDSLTSESPDLTLTTTHEVEMSEPSSGLTSKAKSNVLPSTTVPLLAPSESAEAPAATTHRPAPKMVLRIFTIISVFGADHSCT